MPKRNSLKEVPFLRTSGKFVDGRYDRDIKYTKMMEYVGGYEREPVEWRPNTPFEDTLRIDHLERGRSAARFWFVGSDGTEYPFFGQGLTEMLQRVTMVEGVVTATWIAVKRGANYGLELYDAEA